MSLSKDDLNKEFLCIEFEEEKCFARVSGDEIKRLLNNNYLLAKKLAEAKLKYEIDNKLSSTAAYDKLAEACQISDTELKKAKSQEKQSHKITRNFIYKFVVGLGLELDEANEYFKLCGGPLSEYCVHDYICIKALEDKDDIYDFIDEMEVMGKKKIAMREREPNKPKK